MIVLWDSKNRLKQYTKYAHKLEVVFDELTQDICKHACEKSCCRKSFYQDTRYTSYKLLIQQELEAMGYRNNASNWCNYFKGGTGCVLWTKSPLCLSYICDNIKNELLKICKTKRHQSFLHLFEKSLDDITHYYDQDIIATLKVATHFGKKLVSIKSK